MPNSSPICMGSRPPSTAAKLIGLHAHLCSGEGSRRRAKGPPRDSMVSPGTLSAVAGSERRVGASKLSRDPGGAHAAWRSSRNFSGRLSWRASERKARSSCTGQRFAIRLTAAGQCHRQFHKIVQRVPVKIVFDPVRQPMLNVCGRRLSGNCQSPHDCGFGMILEQITE